MKKQQSVYVFGLGILFFSLAGCSKSGPGATNACENHAEKIAAAANAYVSNPGKNTCESYKAAINDLFKTCPTYYTGLSRQTLEDFNNTPCQ